MKLSRPVIVSGLPRSGTSLMMTMLAAGGVPILQDGCRSSDADNPNGYFEFEPVKRLSLDASWLFKVDGHAIKIVSPLIRFLPEDFAADVILMTRDISEVLASQTVMLTRLGRPAAGDHELLKNAFMREMDLTNQWLSARHNIRSLTLVHRMVVSNPSATVQAIVAFLDLPLNQRAMIAAVDPKLYRQRSAADTSS